jgi:hypothetical protein
MNIGVSPFGCWQFWVTPIFDVTHVVSHNLRPCAPEHRAGWYGNLRKCPLLLELAGDESRQMVAANTRGQNGSRACTCDICNRLAYAFVYRG